MPLGVMVLLALPTREGWPNQAVAFLITRLGSLGVYCGPYSYGARVWCAGDGPRQNARPLSRCYIVRNLGANSRAGIICVYSMATARSAAYASSQCATTLPSK